MLRKAISLSQFLKNTKLRCEKSPPYHLRYLPTRLVLTLQAQFFRESSSNEYRLWRKKRRAFFLQLGVYVHTYRKRLFSHWKPRPTRQTRFCWTTINCARGPVTPRIQFFVELNLHHGLTIGAVARRTYTERESADVPRACTYACTRVWTRRRAEKRGCLSARMRFPRLQACSARWLLGTGWSSICIRLYDVHRSRLFESNFSRWPG